MKVFLDTSSLLKLYHHEIGTERLLNTLSQSIEEIYLSELAILEFHSAIWKKVRTSEIEIVTAKAVMTGFQTDYTQFQWIQLNSKIIQ
jgi:predicted nucleic acid-binding protein